MHAPPSLREQHHAAQTADPVRVCFDGRRVLAAASCQAGHSDDLQFAFENRWDKYKVTLTEIERDRDAAAKQLQTYLKGLRYV